VLLDDESTSDQSLQAVARELAAPTTGFVWRGGPADFRVRFFTSSQEIDMCGHVVIGVASALVDEGLVGPQHHSCSITFRTLAGPIPVSIAFHGQRPEITMTQRPPLQETVGIESSEIAQTLGLSIGDLHPSFPIEVVSTALRHLIVSVRDAAVLSRLRPNYSAVASLCRQARCDTAPVVAFANDERETSWRLRDLCPAIRYDEEPASGTTNGALGCYALAHGIVHSSNRKSVELVGEQGVEQGRPSTIRVRLELVENRVTKVFVSGTAYRSLRGELTLNEAN
jgi:PhzF family phenazine biosynthesis protein